MQFRKCSMKNKHVRGITLTELLIGIAIVALLTGFLIPAAISTQRRVAMKATAAAQAAQARAKAEAGIWQDPISYGHNIYYFYAAGTNFPQLLARFLDVHTNIEVETFASDVQLQNRLGGANCDYGATVGYTVVFKEKPTIIYVEPVTIESTNTPSH
jgi:hypothetical protein